MLEEKVLALRGAAMAEHAESRVPLRESCRNWSVRPQLPLLCALLAMFCIALIMAPQMVLIAFVGWGLFWIVAASVVKVLVLGTVRARPLTAAPARSERLVLPVPCQWCRARTPSRHPSWYRYAGVDCSTRI